MEFNFQNSQTVMNISIQEKKNKRKADYHGMHKWLQEREWKNNIDCAESVNEKWMNFQDKLNSEQQMLSYEYHFKVPGIGTGQNG